MPGPRNKEVTASLSRVLPDATYNPVSASDQRTTRATHANPTNRYAEQDARQEPESDGRDRRRHGPPAGRLRIERWKHAGLGQL